MGYRSSVLVEAVFVFLISLGLTGSRIANASQPEIQGQYKSYAVDGNAGLYRLLETGPDGDVWFNAIDASGRAELGRLSPAGSIAYFPLTNGTSFITALGIGPNGTITFGVSAGSNQSVGEMKTDGTLLFQRLLAPRTVFEGTSLASDPNGNIWLGFSTFSHILGIDRVAPDGTITGFRCLKAWCYAHHIAGVVWGTDGNVWFTYSYSQPEGVGKMSPSGTFTNYPFTGGQYPPGVPVLGSDGNVWFPDFLKGQTPQVGDITPNGTFSFYSLPSPHRTISALASASGVIWFTSGQGLGRITTHGNFLAFYHTPPPNNHLQGVAVGSDGNIYFANPTPSQINELVLH